MELLTVKRIRTTRFQCGKAKNLDTFLKFFSLKIDFCSLMLHNQATVSPPSASPKPSLSPKSTPPPFPLQERIGLRREISQMRQNKVQQDRQEPSYRSWTRPPNRRERVSRAGKRVRHTAPTVGVPQSNKLTVRKNRQRTRYRPLEAPTCCFGL